MKKKTTQTHSLHGSYRADRHEKNTLRFRPASTTAPRYLSKVAKQEWNRVAPMLAEVGALMETDISILAGYCSAYSAWRECLYLIAKQGQIVTVESQTRTGRTSKPIKNPAVALAAENAKIMLSISARFGFTPYDRERIQGIDIPATGDDPFQRFVNNLDDDGADLYPPVTADVTTH
jgi:P27 family predicted phage terminase small subunit